jgi:hypothetical protein
MSDRKDKPQVQACACPTRYDKGRGLAWVEHYRSCLYFRPVEAPAPAQPTQRCTANLPPNLTKCGKCGKEWDDQIQSLVCPHPTRSLESQEISKLMNIANQNALEREAWADRYDKLHIALCQACECLNQGDPATAHRIIKGALTGGDK